VPIGVEPKLSLVSVCLLAELLAGATSNCGYLPAALKYAMKST